MNTANDDDVIDNARERLWRLIEEAGLDDDDDVAHVRRHILWSINRYDHQRLKDYFNRNGGEFPNGWLLHFAVDAESPLQVLEKIVERFPESLITFDEYGSTPLQNFVLIRDDEPIRFDVLNLLTTEESVRLSPTQYSELPLHMYCQRRLLELPAIRLLVDTSFSAGTVRRILRLWYTLTFSWHQLSIRD